jgi:hypothetical protein
MMSTQQSSRGLIWAIIGGLVLVAGIVAIIVTALVSQPTPNSTATPRSTASNSPTASEPVPMSEFVDPDVSERGWMPEPITTDPETYIRAALQTASTFDTTKSSRDEWLDYLDTWFTPDTRYASDKDREAETQAAQLELRQGVVLPREDWDSLAIESGRVTASTVGEIAFAAVSDDSSGDMSIGTADVTLTFTRADDEGNETSYDERVRVSVQVLCGAGSVPTPNTAQQAGDCKVVRYFTEPLEP